jgi:hypothetical protein
MAQNRYQVLEDTDANIETKRAGGTYTKKLVYGTTSGKFGYLRGTSLIQPLSGNAPLTADWDAGIGRKITISALDSAAGLLITRASSELILNGGFDTDTIWVKSGGVISGGIASTAPGDHLWQSFTTVSGKTYRVRVDVITPSAGGKVLVSSIGGGAGEVLNVPATSAGTKIYTFIATAATTYLSFSCQFDVTCTWDNAHVDLSTDLNPVLTIEGPTKLSHRIQGLMGASIASVDDMTLGAGNFFDITGAVTVNGIATAGWQAGSHVFLRAVDGFDFGSSPGTGFAEVNLNNHGASLYSAAIALLLYDGTKWQLVSVTPPAG